MAVRKTNKPAPQASSKKFANTLLPQEKPRPARKPLLTEAVLGREWLEAAKDKAWNTL